MSKIIVLIFIFYSVISGFGITEDFPSLESQLAVFSISKTDLTYQKLEQYIITGGEEVRKGMEMILLPEYRKGTPNYALQLLISMIDQDAVIKGDSITCALALANNYLYSIADASTQAAIKRDIFKHFQYYIEILAWQKQLSITYRIKDVQLIPKIYWSYRFRNPRKFNKDDHLSLAEYNEFIDSIKNL